MLTKIVSILAYLPELNVNIGYCSSGNTIMFEKNGQSYIYEELEDKIFLYKITEEYIPQYALDLDNLIYIANNVRDFNSLYFTKDRKYCYEDSYYNYESDYDFDDEDIYGEEYADLIISEEIKNGPKAHLTKLERQELSKPEDLIKMFDLHECSIEDYVDKISLEAVEVEYPEEYKKAFEDYYEL